ncbi:hypothetical protein EGW08_011050 [Elysia chlorotica]|uniref:Schlafen AlbA-2 domain-containing protein n=1 Tax=Elysia chlorotica TaxID=188477 RepID=A0A433THZ2_ELYCH|nr:hypothetical protein EGW08_011050 [Elysia chlorotica]
MCESSNQEEFGFLMWSLKRSKPDKLANRMFCLLSCIGINCADVTMISLDMQNKFAKVQLSSADAEDYAIKALREKRAVMALFDLRLLTDKPQCLKVERIGARKFAAQGVSVDNREACERTQDNDVQSTVATAGTPFLRCKKQAEVPPCRTAEESDAHVLQFTDLRELDQVLSQTSSTASSPVGFETLDEENVEDYSEAYASPKKACPKSRSMQTSQESSSSCGADYSSKGDSSRTSADDTLSNCAPAPVGKSLEWKSQDNSKKSAGTSFPSAATVSSTTLRHTNESRANSYNCNPLHDTKPAIVCDGIAVPISGNDHNKAYDVKDKKTRVEPVNPSSGHSSTDRRTHSTVKHGSTNCSSTKTEEVSKIVQMDLTESQMVSARTSTHEVGPCFCSGTNFYHRGEQILCYGRNVYLDNGNIVLNDLRKFRVMLGRHVCAFLNSGGGALYFGVDPSDGSVKGLPVSHKYEDALRLDIDRQIKLITPLVPTSAYKVNFAKVMFETGHLMSDVRVLEIEDESSSSWPVAEDGYEFKDVRYIWEDNRVKTAN